MAVLQSHLPGLKSLGESEPFQCAPRQLPNLDLLRCVAVGLVFGQHFLATLNIRVLGNLGRLGVLLFFVHTALVLMMSIERLRLEGTSLYKVFLIRRLFRIYPLSVLSVLVVTLFHIPAWSWWGTFAWHGWPAFFSNLFLVQNITHAPLVNCVLWSLPFENQMYLLLPFLFLWLRRHDSLRPFFAAYLIAVGLALSEYAVRRGPGEMDALLTRYIPCFFAGILAWKLMALRKPMLSGWPYFLIALVFAYRIVDLLRVYGFHSLAALHGTLRSNHGAWPPGFELLQDWAFCLIAGLGVPFFLEVHGRWLRTAAKLVARYSYGIYICHVPVFWLCLVKWRSGSPALGAVSAVVLTAILSVLLYHTVEDPAIRLGKRVAAQCAA